MLAGIAEVTAHSKEVETRVSGDLQVVSGMVKSDKAAQLTINNKVDTEMARILKLSDDNFSSNANARGVIKEVMNKNKETAARETAALAEEGKADLAKARSQQAAKLLAFKQDLSKSTTGLYEKLAKDHNKMFIKTLAGKITKDLGKVLTKTHTGKLAKGLAMGENKTLTGKLAKDHHTGKLTKDPTKKKFTKTLAEKLGKRQPPVKLVFCFLPTDTGPATDVYVAVKRWGETVEGMFYMDKLHGFCKKGS